ncbi:MAG: hypothetical protein JW888_16935 [Pirellulales bacterium]|nr:hypothetical protein [Pirellulales bacterium]
MCESARRGVLLLVVLGLLAMFALIGLTFVILTSHARRSAESQAKVDRYTDPPKELLNEVALQCLRGTTQSTSVLQNHSLLEDLYGPCSLLTNGIDDDGNGTVDDASEAQFIVPATGYSAASTGGQLFDLPMVFSGTGTSLAMPQRLVGCVITMLDGTAKGHSMRIVGVDSTNGTPQVVSYDGFTPSIGDHYIVNGAPFSGTGFGYNPSAATAAGNETDPLLTAFDPAFNWPYALTPNAVGFVPNPAFLYNDPSGLGGANEDYDAADYQNMLLALQMPERVPFGGLEVPAGTTPIPSLHRPSLVDYWFNQLELADAAGTWFAWPSNATTLAQRRAVFVDPLSRHQFPQTATWNWSDPQHRDRLIALKRRILTGPSREDHPYFTGSNPNGFALPLWDGFSRFDSDGDGVPDYTVELDLDADDSIQPNEQFWCDWDVDNDGDGIPDSIWVDVGLPVRSDKEGRLYRPLVAILCVDMDGRLNLNAHGCFRQTEGTYYVTEQLTPPIVAGGGNQLQPMRGQGVGPAEVNLNALLAPPGPLQAMAQCTALIASRYGQNDVVPGYPATTPNDSPPADPLAANQWFDYPGMYNLSLCYDNATNSGTGTYGTPVDLHGTLAMGLDLRGQPLYVGWSGSRADNPYEMNLFGAARGTPGLPGSLNSPDAPFSAAELEALLRPYDADAGALPGRIAALAPSLLPYFDTTQGKWIFHNREVTTESWSQPTPAVVLPPELRSPADAGAKTRVDTWLPTRKGYQLSDLLKARLVAENTTLDDPNNSTQTTTLDTMMRSLLSPDMLAGLRMDVNRLFGSGRDSNNNGVIDEPGETDIPLSSPDVLRYPQFNAQGAYITPDSVLNILDPDNDGTPGVNYTTNGYANERQLYARQLYVQMILLMNAKTGAGLTDAEKDVLRRIAQWAINTVDFRDRDAIMTPFEYDMNPFVDDSTTPDGNPWDVDGKIQTPTAPSLDDGEGYRGLVWGCERPELLISETLAFHDRRTEDLATEVAAGSGNASKVGPNTSDDKDFDQRRRPQGSLFVELYNPWTNTEPKPGELYSSLDVTGGVDLGKLEPVHGTPVWRLAIVSEVVNPGDVVKDPDAPVATDRPTIERAAYFVTRDGSNVPTDTQGGTIKIKYYRRNTESPMAPIRPGRYVVIGPDDQINDGKSVTCIGNCPQGANTRRIELHPSANPNTADQVKVYANGQTDQLASLSIQNPTAIMLGGPGRLSISEPAAVADRYDSTDPSGGAYDPNTETYPVPWDVPQDKQKQPGFWDSCLRNNGTHERLAVVHLQRLANPLKEYHPDANPYLTIDSMQVDLTTFNGVEAVPSSNYSDEDKRSEPDNFFSRERGEAEETVADANRSYNLWLQLKLDSNAPESPNEVSPVDLHVYGEPFACTLGYLNEGYQPAVGTQPGWSPTDETTSGELAAYYGSPKTKAFPWLTWLNRPFSSTAELMLVPKARSSQLLTPDDNNAATPNFILAPASPDPYKKAEEPFGHLVNYFYDDDTQNPPTDVPNWKLHRLLEFLRVPSPFVGTELQGNPATFVGGNHSFHPPFNRIPNYREPGKINLNTITSPTVWRGLMNQYAGLPGVPTWPQFVDSRRGYSATTGDQFALDASGNHLPTRFADPFRSFAGKYLVPDANLQAAVGQEVNATLLRPTSNPGGGGFTNDPLFDYGSTAALNDTTRNPAFRGQLLNRLQSMTTNRSNVYAIWITVGYFEAEPWVNNGTGVNDQGLTQPQFLQLHPDGYRLGRELGTDTGQIERNRAFYLIDRSIPVGFQRGEDLNVEDAILLRRFIE